MRDGKTGGSSRGSRLDAPVTLEENDPSLEYSCLVPPCLEDDDLCVDERLDEIRPDPISEELMMGLPPDLSEELRLDDLL